MRCERITKNLSCDGRREEFLKVLKDAKLVREHKNDIEVVGIINDGRKVTGTGAIRVVRSYDWDGHVCDLQWQPYESTQVHTLVDIQTRETQPRLDLTHLAKTLNELEDEKTKSGFKWEVAGVTDTGPLWRLNDLSASSLN